MYSRKEASQIKHEFWTTFGRYMNPIPSAEGLKINWVNYHTTIKDIFFRMDAESGSATISISIEHRLPEIRHHYFDQFLALKKILHDTLEEEWDWHRDKSLGNRTVSRIEKTLPDISVLNKDDWPELISFFKPRLIALDNFWQDAKWSFE